MRRIHISTMKMFGYRDSIDVFVLIFSCRIFFSVVPMFPHYNMYVHAATSSCALSSSPLSAIPPPFSSFPSFSSHLLSPSSLNSKERSFLIRYFSRILRSRPRLVYFNAPFALHTICIFSCIYFGSANKFLRIKTHTHSHTHT